MKFKKLAALFSAGVITATSVLSVSADTVPMTMKKLDKSYITIVFDDNNADLKRFYEIITLEYGYPICASVPSNTLSGTNTVLHGIENHGGEILSHTKSHLPFNRDVPWNTVEAEMKESYEELTAAGFNVNGIIHAGGGGTEETSLEYRTELEEYTSKYYYYSDLYGVSTQYYKLRQNLKTYFNNNPKIAKQKVQQFAKAPAWEVWYAHNQSELNEVTLRAMLDEIKAQEEAGKLEVVTYREMYTKNAIWQGKVDLGTSKYTVDFYSTDNKTLLQSVVAREGTAATAPKIDTAEGVTFKNWSADFSKVTGNMSVYAVCDGVKPTDAPAVGLKHEHSFKIIGNKQKCLSCGLVTAKTEEPAVSSKPSAPVSSKEPASSAAPSSSYAPVSSEPSVSSKVSSSEAPSSSEPESSKEASSVINSTPADTDTEKKGGINPIIPIGIAAAVAAVAVGAVFIIKSKKKNK